MCSMVTKRGQIFKTTVKTVLQKNLNNIKDMISF